MSVSKVTLSFYEGDSITGEREISVSRSREEFDIYEMMYFMGEALQAMGYTYVDTVGVKYDDGSERWGDI